MFNISRAGRHTASSLPVVDWSGRAGQGSRPVGRSLGLPAAAIHRWTATATVGADEIVSQNPPAFKNLSAVAAYFRRFRTRTDALLYSSLFAKMVEKK